MYKFRLTVIIAFISSLFFSCEKENKSNSQGDRLKMIRIKEGDSLFYQSFQYDDQNRMTTVVDSNNNGHKQIFVISYDAQGKISKVTEGENIYTFEVDDKRRVIKKLGTHPTRLTTEVENTYNNDENGRVITDSLYNFWTTIVYNILTYSYDQNNNVIKTKTVESSGTLLDQAKYTYDTYRNPLEGRSVFTYFPGIGVIIPPGKNNLRKITYSDGTIVNYTYDYYTNGLPKKCFEKDNSDPLITVFDYYYE